MWVTVVLHAAWVLILFGCVLVELQVLAVHGSWGYGSWFLGMECCVLDTWAGHLRGSACKSLTEADQRPREHKHRKNLADCAVERRQTPPDLVLRGQEAGRRVSTVSFVCSSGYRQQKTKQQPISIATVARICEISSS